MGLSELIRLFSSVNAFPSMSVHKIVSQQAHVSLSHPYIYRISTHIWRKLLFRSENLAFYCYSEVSFRDAV